MREKKREAGKMDKVINVFSTAKQNTIQGDFIDKLHSRVTVIILFVVAILVGIRQYDGQTISCWLITAFSDDQTDYVHQFCWINNTYHYPGEKDADKFPESHRQTLYYYQYILFIILGMAVFFYIPTTLWNLLASDSIGYIKKILDQTQSSKLKKRELMIERFKNMKTQIPNIGLLTRSNVENRRLSSAQKVEINEEKPVTDENEELIKPLIDDTSYAQPFVKEFDSLLHVENKRIRKQTKLKFEMEEKENDDDEQDVGHESAEQQRTFQATNARKRFAETKSKSIVRVLSFMRPNVGVPFLAFYYILFKLLNLSNVILQILLLHYVFGRRFYRYGLDFAETLMNNQNPFLGNYHFPIVTICDFYVYREMNTIHWNSAQCLLPINVLIEKLFVVVWAWFNFLIIVTFLNIIAWILELLPSNQYRFLNKYLYIRKKMMQNEKHLETVSNASSSSSRDVKFAEAEPIDDTLIQQFRETYLSSDGVFMLQLVKTAGGDLIFMDLLNELWIHFTNETKKTN